MPGNAYLFIVNLLIYYLFAYMVHQSKSLQAAYIPFRVRRLAIENVKTKKKNHKPRKAMLQSVINKSFHQRNYQMQNMFPK